MSRLRCLPILFAVAAPLFADTLVLRNGRRVEGELVGYRGGEIEFQIHRGRTERFDRREVARIEFEDDRRGRWDDGDRDRDREDSGRRPRGLRERTLSVDATKEWTDTGIDVRRGDSLYFEASGRVTWGPDRRDGPAGEGGNHFNPNRPIPGRPGGALIGRIGRDAFFVGDDGGPIPVRESGRLYLGVNDDYLRDNAGSFRVTVAY